MNNITRFTLGAEPTTCITGYAQNSGRPVLVELVEASEGFVTVAALDGEPFQHPHYGQTDQVTIPASQFTPLFQKPSDRPAEPQRQSMTLLDMALAAAKDAWTSGENQIIWGDPRRGPGQYAYLREEGRDGGGFVNLYIAGIQRGLTVFQLTSRAGWAPVPDLDRKYQGWMGRVKSEVRR